MELIKSESLKELSCALKLFQVSQRPIRPNATNPFLKNRYADLTALIEGTKENLHEYGLCVTQLLTNDGLTTILMHDSGEYIGSTFKIEPTEGKGTNAAQEMGIAITYSRRYAYGAILGLVTDEDTDGSGRNKPDNKRLSSPSPKTPEYEPETGRTSTQAPKADSNGKEREFVPPTENLLNVVILEKLDQDDHSQPDIMLEQIIDMVRVLSGEQRDKYRDLLEGYTEFTGKDGKKVSGTRDIRDLHGYSAKRISVIYGKVKKDWEEVIKTAKTLNDMFPESQKANKPD